VLDNKEIDDTLDEFSKVLSEYGCDGNPTDPIMPSPAQTRLESLFVPPTRAENPSPSSPDGPHQPPDRLLDSIESADKANPSTPVTPVEDEASIR